jgi:hypothetical protein
MTIKTQDTGGSSRFFSRCLPWIFILFGILTVIGGFLYDVIFAGIPYQDATPEMSARYDHHAGIASILRWSGAALCLLGMIGVAMRRNARNSSACLLLLMILYPMDARAQTWSHAPWNDDADSGITSALEYHVAVNTSGDAVTVNGVAFEGDAASGPNFSITGDMVGGFSGANVSGKSKTLANAFIYAGKPRTVTLKNLTPGTTYQTTFFSYGFDPAGTARIQTFASDGSSLEVDQNHYGQGNGIRITHEFVATGTTKEFTITPAGDETFHLSALANRKVAPATILSFGNNVDGSMASIGKPDGRVTRIAWTVPYSANLATLAPAYTVTSGTGTPASGSPPKKDFSAGPVTYTVTDGSVTRVYAVTVTKAPPSKACEITAFHSNLAGSRVTIRSTSPSKGTVVVSVSADTTDAKLAALKPALTLSPGATFVPPAAPLSLQKPVQYRVTAEDGVTTKDYSVKVVADAEAFRLFVVKTEKTGLSAADYDYLSLIPVSRHRNKGVPAVIAIADESEFSTNIYLQDYLRRYRPTGIDTINFDATVPNFTSTPINASGPLELSVAMATSRWKSSSTVVLVSDAVDATNYPNVLQASSLAAALDAPLIYHSPDPGKEEQVRGAIRQLGATEVVYVNAAGTKPSMATVLLTGPAAIARHLAGKGNKVDYLATTNPTDLNLATCAKLSLTAPLVAARRNGIVVPITSWACNPGETMHYAGYPAIKAELKQLYQAMGRHPSFLALVGGAHSVPLAYRVPNDNVGNFYGSPADLDYADVDSDPFLEIAIGRIMAYNIQDATLLTSRISTYEQLVDGIWEKMMIDVGGQWNSAFQNALGANYGFSSINLVQSLGATQPVEAAIIGHNDHSSQHVLGGALDVNSTNVLAPAVIFSQGCAVASIDLDVDNQLVVNQLFKMGAVAFCGSTRVNPGGAKQMQSAMLNALLSGEPLGRGYMVAMDSFSCNGVDDQRWNYIFLGDPGLRMHVPNAPKVPPASHVMTPESSDSAILTVNIPSTLFTPEVDSTWCAHWGLDYPAYWGEKPGLYGADVDRFYLIRQTIPKPILNVEELDFWPTKKGWLADATKLGMLGQPTIDEHQDGTRQLVWAIRANIMDWPKSKSRVPLAAMTRGRFRINYSSGKAITAFHANFPGSTATVRSLSETTGSVVVYVPPGTKPSQVAALAPSYTLDSGATCDQPNHAVPNQPMSLNRPTTYIVTPRDPANLPARAYSVSVTTKNPTFHHTPWTGDLDSGITSKSTYTAAVNLAGAKTTVNGVTFEASTLSGANFSIGGDAHVVASGSPNLTGSSLSLASDFIYNGNPRTLTLLNLTPGKTYETSLFSYGWEDTGRSVVVTSGRDSCVIDQDAYGAGNGIRIVYRFVATSSNQTITITPVDGSVGTFHLCAIANRIMPETARR